MFVCFLIASSNLSKVISHKQVNATPCPHKDACVSCTWTRWTLAPTHRCWRGIPAWGFLINVKVTDRGEGWRLGTEGRV